MGENKLTVGQVMGLVKRYYLTDWKIEGASLFSQRSIVLDYGNLQYQTKR